MEIGHVSVPTDAHLAHDRSHRTTQMLYRFQSRETADLLMLQPVAERVLALLGKDAAAPGVLTWTEMPQAISCLKTEVERERLALLDPAPQTESPEETPSDQADHSANLIQFRQRVAPFIAALERCHAAQKDLIWVF
jgi:Domain of unknown function (DUF1840)